MHTTRTQNGGDTITVIQTTAEADPVTATKFNQCHSMAEWVPNSSKKCVSSCHHF